MAHDNDEKLELFVQRLQNIFRSQIEKSSDPIIDRRERYIAAFYMLGMLIRKKHAGKDIEKHFWVLASALDGLQYGITHPILQAAQPSGRRRDRSDVWKLRVSAANGVECLIKSGLTRKAAAQKAAKEFPELEKLLRPRGDGGKNTREKITLAASLLSWRDAVANDAVQDALAAGSARTFRDFIQKVAPKKQFADAGMRKQFADAGMRYLQSAASSTTSNTVA
jgi:hypothetical protein